jgi:PAS domain S-box-containing protein
MGREAGMPQAEDTLNYRNLIEHSSDAIVVHDPEGKILYANPAALALVGDTSLDAAMKRSVFDHLLPEIAEGARQDIQKLLEGETLPPLVTPLFPLHGDPKYVEVRLNPVQFGDGTAIQVQIRDVTRRTQVEEALQDSEEKFRRLIQCCQDGIILNDDCGVIVEWNEGMEYITGILRQQAIGRTLPDISRGLVTGPMKKEEVEQWILSLIAEMDSRASSAENPHVEVVIRRPDGAYRTIEAKKFRFTRKGRFFYGAMIRDITERKRIEDTIHESEEKYRTLVEMSPDAIIIHQEGRIIYANPAANRNLGASHPEDLIGRGLFDLIHPDFHVEVRKNIQEDLKGDETPATEVQMIRLDNTSITVEGKGKRIFMEGKPAIQVVLRDITERKIAEQRLQEYAENLKRSNEDLQIFAHIATHDLQEPIRGIVAFSQILLKQCSNGICQSPERYLRLIESAGLRMHALVNDLRTYSSVGAHRKPLEQTDMESVLSCALDNLQLVIKDTQAMVTHDPLPTVFAERTRMIPVFQNLIDNSIKFGREGVVPTIHISASAADGMWKFAVQDNGIGIPSEYFGKIFILFERLNRKENYPGTGLGLALCKRIVEGHGGRIWVESEVGVGSTFYFTLPQTPLNPEYHSPIRLLPGF